MEITTNLGLKKPDYNNVADIEILNENFQKVDDLFDGSKVVRSVNGVAPVNGNAQIDLGVTSVNGMTGAVTITERSVKQLIDIIYPVGSYYDTSNTSFNPNTAWSGTTWERITDGRVLIAGGGSYIVGNNYGELTHKLTINELPSHSHTNSITSNGSHNHTSESAGSHNHTTSISTAGNHNHTRGSMNITGQTYGEGGGNGDYGVYKGAFYMDNSSGIRTNGSGDTDNDNRRVLFDASRSWTGVTSDAGSHSHTLTIGAAGSHNHTISTVGNHTHTVTIGNTGNNIAFNLLPLSTAVARWHRTA